MKDNKEFIVVFQHAWMNEGGYGVHYGSDLRRYRDRAKALRETFREKDHDDFNIGTVVGNRLVAFGWGENDFGPDDEGLAHGGYDLDEIADEIGLTGSPS